MMKIVKQIIFIPLCSSSLLKSFHGIRAEWFYNGDWSIQCCAKQSFLTIVFNHPIASKLDQLNFVLWKKQVELSVRGHRLQNHISQIYQAPSKYLTQADEIADQINLEFADWDQQDQLILSWLFASMSDNLVLQMINCESTSQLWKILGELFGSQVRVKISQYKIALHNTKKETYSINDYLLRIRNCIDLLSLVGHKTCGIRITYTKLSAT